MRVELVKAPPLDYDPYEEDCCGAHSADKLMIYLDGGKLTLELQEIKSGIGPEYRLTAKTNDGQAGNGKLIAFIDDEGELNFYFEGAGSHGS